VDWVLVEGFKDSDLHKIEIWRTVSGKPALYLDDPFIAAIATDSPADLPVPTGRPVLDLNQPDDVAAWLVENGNRFDYSPETYAP
jgi:molybdopterin-guanine dinucleotide biosynthesis protein B